MAMAMAMWLALLVVAGSVVAPSPASAATATVPGRPTNVVTVGGAGTLTVSWTRPDDGGSPLRGYILSLVAVSPSISGVAETVPADATSYTFRYLAATQWAVYLIPYNAVGNGKIAISPFTTVTASVPRPPSYVNAVTGNGQATVSWPQSLVGRFEQPATGYQVEPLVDGVPGAPIDVGADARSAVVPVPNGSTTSFVVRARNDAGLGIASSPSTPIAIGAPSPPGVRSALPGDGTLTVDWTAPITANGSAVTSYEITPVVAGVAQPTQVFDATARSGTLVGLVNGVRYDLRVAATNRRGVGVATTRIPFGAVLVGSPLAPTVTAEGGAGSVTARWSLPIDNGSPVQRFEVRFGSSYGGALLSAPLRTAATQITFRNVEPGTGYVVLVSGENSRGVGIGGLSNEAVPFTTPSAPGTPTAVPGPGSAEVSWAAPAADGGRPITGYVVTPYVDGVALPARAFDASTRTRTIAGLVDGVRHTFQVAAVNDAGVGAPSTRSATVRVGVPLAPGGLSSTVGDGSATLRWTAPVDNGSPILRYLVTPYRDGVAQGQVVVGAPATATTLTGLDNGSTYTFTVAAVNARGTGARSARGPLLASAVGTPSMPGEVSAVGGLGSVEISWGDAVPNGRPVVDHVVIVVPEGGSIFTAPQTVVDGAERTVAVAGLPPGPAVVYVLARNEFGAGPASISSPVIIG